MGLVCGLDIRPTHIRPGVLEQRDEILAKHNANIDHKEHTISASRIASSSDFQEFRKKSPACILGANPTFEYWVSMRPTGKTRINVLDSRPVKSQF